MLVDAPSPTPNPLLGFNRFENAIQSKYSRAGLRRSTHSYACCAECTYSACIKMLSPDHSRMLQTTSDATVFPRPCRTGRLLCSTQFSSGAASLLLLPEQVDQQERRCLVGFHHGTLRSLVQCADGWRVASAVKPHRGERCGRQAGQYLLHAIRSRRPDARATKVSADAGQHCCAWLAAGGKAQASCPSYSNAFLVACSTEVQGASPPAHLKSSAISYC